MDDVAPPKLTIAPRVTRKHGERFARKWREMTEKIGEIGTDSFWKADVIEWPDGPDGEVTPEQERFQNVEDEILARTFAAVEPVMAEAFVQAARAILARERGRK